MGTRCLTIVQDDNKDVMVMYRQYDGYPDGHGKELADFLKGITIGNGISGNKKLGSFANGMGCLAAQIVCHFKKQAGGFYLYPSESRDCGEEFTYVVTEKDGKAWLKIHEGTVAFFGCAGRIKSDDMPCIWEGFACDFDAEKIVQNHHQPHFHTMNNTESEGVAVHTPVGNKLEIGIYIHCAKCIQEKPSNISPKDWSMVQAGWTPKGLQVWCNRHDCNILHIDFQGQKHPASTTTAT